MSNQILIFAITLCFTQSIYAQKSNTLEYIDTGLKIIELFRNKPNNSTENCTTLISLNNKKEHSIHVHIEDINMDSIVSKIITPKRSKGNIYSLNPGLYKCVIKDFKGETLMSTELQIKKCNAIEIQIK